MSINFMDSSSHLNPYTVWTNWRYGSLWGMQGHTRCLVRRPLECALILRIPEASQLVTQHIKFPTDSCISTREVTTKGSFSFKVPTAKRETCGNTCPSTIYEGLFVRYLPCGDAVLIVEVKAIQCIMCRLEIYDIRACKTTISLLVVDTLSPK